MKKIEKISNVGPSLILVPSDSSFNVATAVSAENSLVCETTEKTWHLHEKMIFISEMRNHKNRCNQLCSNI